MMTAYLLEAVLPELGELTSKVEQTGEFQIIGQSLNPLEALEQLALLKPQVLFLEQNLQGLPGLAVAERAKRLLPNLQIVVVTHSSHFALCAFEHQVADYLLKPVEPGRLSKTAARLKLCL